MPSRITTTSWPASTRRLAFSMASSASWVCSSLGRSKVEAMTSPCTVRRMSVTSSGRSSMSRTISVTSGLFRSIEVAMVFMMKVLPAFGGDTMRPRWPLPIGAMRSMIRAVMLEGSAELSSRSFSSGNSGVRSSNLGRRRASSGSPSLTVRIWSSAGFFSLPRRDAGQPGDLVALAQPVLTGLLHRHVHVVAAGQVAVDPEEAVALVPQIEVAAHLHGLDRRPRAPTPERASRKSRGSRPSPGRSTPCGPSSSAPPLRRRRRRRRPPPCPSWPSSPPR